MPHESEMIDLMFDVSGGMLPAAYPYSLWEQVVKLIPQLAEHAGVGIIPLRMAESLEGMLLPKRAKLIIRMPQHLAAAACGLAHQRLDIGASVLQLGDCKTRPIQSYSTLHAQLVIGADDEIEFVSNMDAALNAMGVKAKLICGQHRILQSADMTIKGYSLVLHDLAPEASLRVQCAGLGEGRKFGCGLFVPYKVISGLE